MNTCLKAFSLQVNSAGGCPPGGTPTPSQITQNVNVDWGNQVPDPSIGGANHYSFGILPSGLYTITYTGGAFFDTDNPCPSNYKFLSYSTNYFTSLGSPAGIAWNGPVCGPNQAAVEAGVPINSSQSLDHQGAATLAAQIDVEFFRIGPADGFVAGAPNPTFNLLQTLLYPVMPINVRIHNYNAGMFTPCVGGVPSANPAWDGTMGDGSGGFLYSPQLPGDEYAWDSLASGQVTINGQSVYFAEIVYVNDGSAPTPSGYGWDLAIYLSPSVILWHGVKGVGTDPVGCYDRIEGCSAGPQTITVESD